tara:strand:- start:333 stop:605 length:273 start_codon:yes stop_codon:yes gene_type:complete
MDHNKLASEVSRGEKAKLLLDEPLIKEAFETLKKEFQDAILHTKHNEDEARRALWQAYHLTDRVENHLRTVMETGKLAATQINQLKKNST